MRDIKDVIRQGVKDAVKNALGIQRPLEKIKILFLSANPRGTTELDLNIEAREIQEKRARAEFIA